MSAKANALKSTALKSAALKLVSTSTRRKTGLAGSAQSRQFQQFATMWNALPMDDRNAWKALAQTANAGTAVNLPAKRNGYSMFTGINTMLNSIGLEYNTTAPATPEQPYSLPVPTLTASMSGGPLAMIIQATAPFTPQVIVYAAPPAYAGNNKYSNKSFKRVGVLSGISAGAHNITALYQTKFRIPAPGYEVALKLVGVMDSGFHTNSVLLTAIVTG